MPDGSPTALYSTRLAEREASAARLDVQHDRFANARLVTVWRRSPSSAGRSSALPEISALWLLLPAAVFAALAAAHARVLAAA